MVEEIKNSNGNTPEVYYLIGLSELYQANNDKAKKYFNEGIRLDPDHNKCIQAIKIAKR